MYYWQPKLVIDGVELSREDTLATWLYNVNEALKDEPDDPGMSEEEAWRAKGMMSGDAFFQCFCEIFIWREPEDDSMTPAVWFNDPLRRKMGWPQQIERAYDSFLRHRVGTDGTTV